MPPMEQAQALFAAAEHYGSVDVAFSNAGISPEDDSILTTRLQAWQPVRGISVRP